MVEDGRWMGMAPPMLKESLLWWARLGQTAQRPPGRSGGGALAEAELEPLRAAVFSVSASTAISMRCEARENGWAQTS